MISLEEVSVRFGRHLVVDRVSAEVARGEWVALIGPNGAGKTTLLRAVMGLVHAEGTISVGGDPVTTLARRELARRVALVPQIPVLPPAMTVAEYVALGRTPYISYLATESRRDLDAVERALGRLELVELADRSLDSLSGGERQRAVLARALVQDAPVLLLDEPTSALDIGHQQQALELLDTLRVEVGLTLVAAMHDLTLAGQYADRVLLVDQGRLVADGSPETVFTEQRLGHHYGASVRVLRHAGGIAVVPERRARPQT
ncbi:MAG: ABC transporter ATP-binding protein [Actinobacteria bacterium]|nr:MAG: ABC transporter ATP-binding protein [Actinomycetota bacterium]